MRKLQASRLGRDPRDNAGNRKVILPICARARLSCLVRFRVRSILAGNVLIRTTSPQSPILIKTEEWDKDKKRA